MEQQQPIRAEGAALESLARRRQVLVDAATALTGLVEMLWQAGGADLPALLGQLDQVAALAAAGRVAVTAEAVQRGEVATSQAASTTAWVAEHAPSLATGGAGAVAKLVEATKTRGDRAGAGCGHRRAAGGGHRDRGVG